MSPNKKTIAKVMEDVDAALSNAMTSRIGATPDDSIYFFDVITDEKTTVAIGDRERMRAALAQDRRIEAGGGAHGLLGAPAPAGFVWIVIDWGEDVSTLLVSPANPGRWSAFDADPSALPRPRK